MKEASGASTFTEVKDKVERMPVWDTFKSPLAQLGYTSEDEAIYKDLKIDMTTVKEDVEYSLGLKRNSDGLSSLSQKFANNKSLKYAPFIDTSNATSISGMFDGCSNLLTASVVSLDLSKTLYGANLFRDCSSLEYINYNGFSFGKVSEVQGTFERCSSLKALDMSSVDISKIKNMNSFVNKCVSLDILKINGFGENTSIQVSSAFLYAPSLGSTEEGMDSLRYTFITNSFDRAAAGYSSINLQFDSSVKARFTDEEKAAITAKGFTIA
jgi:hypothetical protein